MWRGLPGTVFSLNRQDTLAQSSESDRSSEIFSPLRRGHPAVTSRARESLRTAILHRPRALHSPSFTPSPRRHSSGRVLARLTARSGVRISQGKNGFEGRGIWPRPHPRRPSTSPRVVASSSVRAHTMWSSARSSTRSASSWRGCPRCVHPRTVASLPFYQLANTRSSPLRCRSPSPRTRVSGSPARCTIVPWRSPAS